MKNKLKDALEVDLTDGLTQLKEILLEDSPYENEVRILRTQVRELMASQRMNTKRGGDYRIEKNSILNSALSLVDNLKSSDLKTSPDKQVSILVICRNEDDRKYIAHYMGRFQLPDTLKVDTQVIKTFTFTDEYDLIVFDNRSIKTEYKNNKIHYPVEKDLERLDLMEEYIHGTSAYILHFGPTWTEMDNYRDRMHACNSIFALHARLHEMIHYIKDIQITQS